MLQQELSKKKKKKKKKIDENSMKPFFSIYKLSSMKAISIFYCCEKVFSLTYDWEPFNEISFPEKGKLLQSYKHGKRY